MATDIVAYGLYKDRASFERAVDALRAANFRNSDVSAILPDRDHTTKDLAHEINTKTPEGIAAGAGAGAALAACSAGSWAWARLPFRGSGRSSRRVPWWRHSQARARRVQPAVSLVG